LSRSIGIAHIIRHDDRTTTGVWGPFELKSAFQPIFAFRDGKLSVAAFEGLIRPFRDGDAMPPGAFFRAIPAGDRLHVETLTRSLHLLNAGQFLDPSTKLFVNFDPSVFTERQIAETALREMRLTLHEAGIDPRRIVCEVTEQKSTSQQALATFVGALRDSGFKIAVDDYGAEDSDMERVSALKPDIVKFDAQWITRLMDSRPGFALLSVMVKEFASRGIVTLFEGIEEGWQLEMAEESGVEMVQGYVLARPEIAPTSFAIFAAAGRAEAGSEVRQARPGAVERQDPIAVGSEQPLMPRRPSQAQRSFGRRGRT
jgi:EAL domain-containing protein (putative c-di-GMP-specific phosphodiesterase class I)